MLSVLSSVNGSAVENDIVVGLRITSSSLTPTVPHSVRLLVVCCIGLRARKREAEFKTAESTIDDVGTRVMSPMGILSPVRVGLPYAFIAVAGSKGGISPAASISLDGSTLESFDGVGIVPDCAALLALLAAPKTQRSRRQRREGGMGPSCCLPLLSWHVSLMVDNSNIVACDEEEERDG